MRACQELAKKSIEVRVDIVHYSGQLETTPPETFCRLIPRACYYGTLACIIG